MPDGNGNRAIEIFPDSETLAHAAADLWARAATDAARTRGRFSVALAGGSTPRRMYEVLASDAFRGRVPWERVYVFWGDERCVPLDDPSSNCRMARQAFLDHVPIPPGQIHPIANAENPKRAADDYEWLLRQFFQGGPPQFDLVLLGLGEDGHTASLFPGTIVLQDQVRWAAETRPPGQALTRVTLTAPAINGAKLVIFLVSGAGKANVLHDVLEGPRDALRLPAQLIVPVDGQTRWLIDAAAGARIVQR